MTGVLAIGVFSLALALFAWVAISRAAGIAKRTSLLVRRLDDPVQLESLIGEQTRAALRRAGVEPMTALQPGSDIDPALRERVAADVKRALEEALKGGLGFRRPGAAILRGAGAGPSCEAPRASEPPPPYAAGGDPGARLRAVLAVAVIAATAALVFALR